MKADDMKQKRGKRGTGRLYKRDGGGKEYPATSRVKGDYWLQYQVNGKRVRVRLLDEAGRPIATLKKAEAERAKILHPLNTKDRAEQLRFVKARLEEAEKKEVLAVEEASPPLLISDAWEAYVDNPDRPDSGGETMRSYEGHWSKFTRWLGQKEAPPKYLRDITPKMAREYAAHLNRVAVSTKTGPCNVLV